MSHKSDQIQQPVAPEALEGGRRPTGKASGATSPSAATINPEVNEKKPRRRFTAEFKLKLLEELDRCSVVSERGAIIRREGLFSSQISDWRQARDAGALGALNQKRGRKKKQDPKDDEITSLQATVEALQSKLAQAEAIMEVQKKVSEIFGIKTPTNEKNERSS